MVQRLLDVLKFLMAVVLAMVDGMTQWLNLLTKQYVDTSTVLCNERYLLIHKISQVRAVREHTHTPALAHTNTHTRWGQT